MAFFQGRALWMISVSVNGTPIVEWGEGEMRMASRVIERVLEGVGDPSTDVMEGGTITVNVRRQCSDEERRKVREPYLVRV